MSDNWITVIPKDPHLIPASAARERARECLAIAAPAAEAVEIILHDGVQFFDCGSNFESISCPHCSGTIPVDWWQDRMGDDYAHSFKLAAYFVPCCGRPLTLNDLTYNWPQGFARFGISAMNPDIGRLSDEHVGQLAGALGCAVSIIYQHI